MKQVNVFLAGFQKCATTWLHTCLAEHPSVFVPKQHMLHYYDINYFQGAGWYESFYKDSLYGQIKIDTTVTYARCEQALKRIAEDVPDAKIILSIRNPIERAFSHYWHEKKKEKISFTFREFLTNYDLYTDWIETGFYSRHIDKISNYFSTEQIMVVLVDDIETNPKKTIASIYDFIGVDCLFVPSIVNMRTNVAWSKKGISLRLIDSMKRRTKNLIDNGSSSNRLHHLQKFLHGIGTSEYEKGIEPRIKEMLSDVYREEVESLSLMFNRDLNEWLN